MAHKRRAKSARRFRKGKRRKAMPVVIMKRRRRVRPSQQMIAKQSVRTLTYATFVTINVTTIPVFHVMRANSCFDPDLSGGGHQPLGFDQMMLLYNKYTVLHSNITVDFQFAPDINAAAQPAVVGIRKGDVSGTFPNTAGHIIELRRVKYKTLQYHFGSNNTARVKFGQVPWKTLGFDNARAEDYIGTVSTDPAVIARWEIFVASLDNTVDIPPVQVCIRMSYKTLFFQPETELVQS